MCSQVIHRALFPNCRWVAEHRNSCVFRSSKNGIFVTKKFSKTGANFLDDCEGQAAMRVCRSTCSWAAFARSSGVRKQRATKNVTTAPKATRQGNSMRGSHAGAQSGTGSMPGAGGWRSVRKSVVQSALESDDDEAAEHGDDVADFVAAPPGEEADEENAEQRAVYVAEDSEHDRDDARVEDDLGVGG